MQPGFWRHCRVGIRWLRRAALVAVAAAIGAFLWFNRVGLPDFLKRRLVESLHERGVELQFDRMRLSLVLGLVAENVRIGQAASGSPALAARQVRLELDYAALLHRRLQLAGLVLHNGRFTLPLSATNALALDNIQSELRFLPDDTWSLDNLQADFANARLKISGAIAHAPELRNWEIFRAPKTPSANAGSRAALEKFSGLLQRIHLAGGPQLSLAINGDALDPYSFTARLLVRAPSARTPWGGASDIQLSVNLEGCEPAAGGKTSSGAQPSTLNPQLVSWWTNLQPFRLAWTARLAGLKSPGLDADSVACAGVWSAPELAVTNLSARLGGGTLDGRADLNAATREFSFTNDACFDLHAVAALLTDKTRARLADFSWTQPPSLRAAGSMILPAWTNHGADWRTAVQPTIRLNGELALTNAAMSGFAFDSAGAHFSYSNLVWQLPDLALAQAQTRLDIAGWENDATRDYRWRLRGEFDPAALKPFLTASNAARGLGHLTFTQPVHLDAEISGRLYDYDRLAADGRAALTNFTIRGESVDSVAGDFAYTNRVLVFSKARLWRGAETMTADAITLDFNRRLISFHNGYSTAEPEMVARAIGPKTGKLLSPYQFLQPPTVFVEGCAPLRDVNGLEDMADADLRFEVVGGAPFQCLKFRAARLAGTAHWLGGTLELTNLAAELYGGSGSGSAVFDFRAPHEGADYHFTAAVTNIDLHALAADLSSRTNHLEGRLAGRLVVTRADTRDWRAMDGYGRAELRNGLLWDIPVFGIVSPVLNAVSPGLGNSQATEATAAFTITNGVIYSGALEINTALTRLDYAGTVDLRENLNARVTAQLLRNLPALGPVISLLASPFTKLFEFRVTGTLRNPIKEPVYVPKFLLMPLHPIRSLEEIFNGDIFFSSPTNTPPGN